MQRFLKIYIMVVATIILSPFIAFAQANNQVCSPEGYTVETINGVLTNDDGAVSNKRALELLFPGTYKGEKLTFDFLLNPTRYGGVSDTVDTLIQKFFQNEVVKDYDLTQIFQSAAEKVKTQKLLLVAHSQGNFYANSFYDVATREGGVSPQSLGVYAVASPSNHLAKRGSGLWLTSYTDHVISGLVGGTIGGIMPPNIYIAEVARDTGPFSGHDFSEVYLKYTPNQVAAGVYESLRRLSYDPGRNPNASCIKVPRSLTASLLYITENSVILAVDTTLEVAPKVATAVKETAIFAANTVKDTAITAATWSYNTTVVVGKFVGNSVVVVSSAVFNAIASALSNGTLASNNMASVILATQTPQPQVTQSSPLVSASNNKVPIVTQALPANNQIALVAPKQSQTVFVFEPKVQNGTSAPKLVFVGSFGSGGGSTALPSTQVLGSQTVVVIVDEATTDGEMVGGAGSGVALAAPALSVPQCVQTLATDGCLLATTTIHFEWEPISGAEHYLINKNGEYATTTDTSFDISARDFSDYILGVVAVGADGQSSATSTQAVSVATIPIAINEIAWMGTIASASDEWFEIKNNTAHTIDLSQWVLNAKDNAPHVVLKGTIAPHAYIIFERTNDTAVKDILAHATTTGALNNPGDQLTLLRDSVVFDQTPDGAWPAGATSTRQTMERYSSRESGIDPANWGTNLGYIKNGTDANGNAIDGTPGAQNSVSTLINKGQDITSDFTLTNAEEQYVIANALRVSASSTLTIEPGVEIKFYDGWIRVAGQLVVAGTQGNPVTIGTFSGNQDGGISVGGGWIDGVYQGTNSAATFDNVNIENINYIDAYDSARLDISNMDLLNSSGGIYSLGNAQISLASSSIRNTQDNHAVAVYENSKITIASSTITNTFGNYAVGVYNGAMAIINTTIDGAPDGGGIYAYRATLDISSSTIKNVSDSGLALYGATSTISNVTIENTGYTGIEIGRGNTTITDTTISDITGWAGVSVDYGILSISSSTIKNVSDYGIATYKATSTISNVVVENGGGNGIDIYQGTAMIAGTTVSGFGGSGISVTDPTEPVAIAGGEITGNANDINVDSVSSVVVSPDVSVHDNGTSEVII